MRYLRVVSWNVGRLYTPTNNNRFDLADVPRVVGTLWELDPDVALLQELVDEGQLSALTAGLPGFRGALAERCRYDRKVAVLVRERLEPAFEQHVLEPTGRGVAVATFDVGRGRRAAAHTLHFDVFNKRRRRSQAEALLRLVDARVEPLVIAGGDLNLDPQLADRLRDPVDAGTFALLAERFPVPGPPPGEPTLLGLFRVDHVFVRGREILSRRLRVSPRRRLPLGDHDPVVCDVELQVDRAAAGT
jgi:endonuclease/exonuclease/phosphatase family metal-dependent hydrolase